ncbi:MAG: carbon storage regulator [Planctomycetaceae bacterium]|nr:carbon storage regulator [Planctomycetaceae bacterium]
MLVLSRKPGEAIFVGDSISIRVSEIRGNRVKLCIDAPPDVRVLRSEVAAQIETQDVPTGFVEFLPPPVAMAK